MYTSYKKANMSDSTLLNSLPKIYFDRKKNRGISYVKAYDGNAWNADMIKVMLSKSIPSRWIRSSVPGQTSCYLVRLSYPVSSR